MSIGATLAGRCHVADSNVKVIRYIRSRMQKRYRKDPSRRDTRKQVYRDALKAHAANQRLYCEIVRGEIGGDNA